MGPRTVERAGWLVFLVIPFVMLAWLLPFVSNVTLGNDYPIFGPSQQIELMWSAWKGTFPLYMPGFAGGHASAAMTLGQLYHPLAWISSFMPGYRDGWALEWNTFFRLVSLGIAHAFLFKLCRRLRIEPLPSFLVTFPVIYNLRMLDSFRYGPSLDAYVGMVLGTAATGFLYFDRASKRPIALLGVCTFLLSVSGHPQWAFLGCLGVGLFALLFPWLAVAFDPEVEAPSVKSLVPYAKRFTVGFGTGVLLASPNLLTFCVDYLMTNQSRITHGYAWTLKNSDSVLGEICNFLLPFHADVHGAFAGSALFLVAALFPIAALMARPPKVLWLLYSLVLLSFLYALGKETWIHFMFVKAIPLFNTFRVPGRLTIWIPLFAFPIWAWLLRPSNRPALVAACVLAVILCASQGFWMEDWLPSNERYSPHGISTQGLPASLDILVLGLSGVSVLLLGCAAGLMRFSRALTALSIVTMLATTWLCLRYGTWRAPKEPTPTFAQITAARKTSVSVRVDPGTGMEMESITAYLRHGLGIRKPLGAIRHSVEHANSEIDILRRLQVGTPNTPLLVNRPVEPLSPEWFADHDQIDLAYNTSNRFVFDVTAAADGYFVLGLPWLPGFGCKVDGAKVAIAKADALLPAVFIPHGTHQVDFYFVSWAFLVGVALVFMTVLAWALWVFHRGRLLIAMGAIPCAAVLAWLLHGSILGGPTFATQYHWIAPQSIMPRPGSPD